MKRKLLLGYQLLAGLSDTTTGLLLVAAPATTLHLMRLHAPSDAFTYLSYVGVFVLGVGIACLYGARLATRPITERQLGKLETVWLLTAISRALVAGFVVEKIAFGTLEAGWITVALTDGGLALVQFIGLAKGWLNDVEA